MPGELLDLGPYPGARKSHESKNRVRGELYQLRRPAHDLGIVDEIEGFDPGRPEGSEFVRELAEVIFDNAGPQRAWVYWLSRDAGTTRRIESGDYAQGWGTAGSAPEATFE